MANKLIAPHPGNEALSQMYLDRLMTIPELASELGVSQNTAREWLLAAGIKPHKRRYKRRYSIEPILDFLDTPSNELWYFIGLVYADGCLHITKNGGYQVSISSTDRQYLEQVATMVKYPKMPTHAGKGCQSLVIYSKAVLESLLAFGLTPRKSLTMQFPSVPAEYLGPFVLGYFDGDGSVRTKNLNSFPPSIEVRFYSGSTSFLQGLGDALASVGIAPTHLTEKPERCTVLSMGAKGTCLKLIRLMYFHNPIVFLERKWLRLAMFLGWSGLLCPHNLKSLPI